MLFMLRLGAVALASAQILFAQYRYPSVGGDQNRTETYLIPAPTASPMSPSWSPDGGWIAFSMWGSIWRVPASGGTAEELTRGPGYDYQPSYSPDGQRIVFVRDKEGQLDLWEYSSRERQLTNDEAVDLLPSYGPAGDIIFYSSRAGNFDIWKYPLKPLTSGPSRDIQPSHSPTTSIIAFVSTRDSPLGTGGLWTLDVETSQTSLVHWVETRYRARPVFSPDGNELLFSSDGDLWRVPASGGVPIRVTNDPAQDIDGQWSPDGEHIVYSADARDLRIVRRDGGDSRPVKISKHKFKRPTGLLKVNLDGPARVSIEAADGRSYTPLGAWHHVASATETHYFYASGSFEIELPLGKAQLRVSRGFEHTTVQQDVQAPGTVNVQLARRFDLPGWYSGDTHVHDLHSGIYPITAGDMATAAAAENLSITNLLVHMDGTKLQGKAANMTGRDDPRSTKRHIVHYAEEYRSSLGHLSLLGVSELLYPMASGIRGTSLALPWPPLFEVAERARRAGAIIGFPHPYYPKMASGSVEGVRAGRSATELPVDVALGVVDFYDISCIWSEDKLAAEIYYKLLNSGFKLPVAGGTDSFSDVPRDPPHGTARTYVQVDGPLTYRKWIEALKAGRSFATNGPLLTLTVNGREIGDEVVFDEPATVHVEAEVMSNVPIESLEIVVNGKIAKATGASSISMELQIETSSWLAARALGPAHPLVGDSYAFAHTSPIYVRIGESKFEDGRDSEFLIRYIRELKAYLKGLEWKNSQRLGSYLDAYDRAIEAYRSR